MVYETVVQVVNDAMVDTGLRSADVTDPFADTGADMIKVLRWLKTGGRDLAARRRWKQLNKEYTFPTVNGVNSYALPSDFLELIPDTSWNRSTALPLGGPVDGTYWQFRLAVPTGGALYTNIRFWLDQIWLEPTPASVMTIAFEYASTSWLKTAAGTVPTLSAPAAKDDVIYFNPTLIKCRLKLDIKRKLGFDYTTEEEDYETALYNAERADSPSGTLIIGSGGNSPVKPLDRTNIPDTIV
jgi:hypothetical protein